MTAEQWATSELLSGADWWSPPGGARLLRRDPESGVPMARRAGGLGIQGGHEFVDLTDDATGGILLAMLARWRPAIHWTRWGWAVRHQSADGAVRKGQRGSTIAEACALALLDVLGTAPRVRA